MATANISRPTANATTGVADDGCTTAFNRGDRPPPHGMEVGLPKDLEAGSYAWMFSEIVATTAFVAKAAVAKRPLYSALFGVDDVPAARSDPGGEDQRGGGPAYPRHLEYPVDDLTQMVVVPCHHPAQQVRRPRCHVRLDHLGDGCQVLVDRQRPALGDLEGYEGGHGVAEHPKIELGAEARDGTGLQEPVQVGLGGVASHPHFPGDLQQSGTGKRRERRDQPLINAVQIVWLHYLISILGLY